ncbi:hypothetical protein TRFO_31671 [Tritrichomonas foetus]|uniref:Uncharacterized protein n=1 Tax=Tritrichomonas foetus TaxID=1144522 RepID=A0A1J4JVD4_9EUKA|nr:hypothetical protein TRFO_31671 [Tritrichomonas foetus]|eukprot:OHT01486.1 hypothetical protein TRFO_31671 [Tritrichomonas foetus]
MDDISSEIEACKSPTADHSEIVRVLVRLQTEVNWQFLRPYSKLDIENFLTRFWNFILFASAYSNTSVRLSAYRTSGVFLLKITPYYPFLMQKTFLEAISTENKASASSPKPPNFTQSPPESSKNPISSPADQKSASIIVAAFSFLSNFVATPYINEFLKKINVFKYFPAIDQTFSDRTAPIIKNLGRLGKNWLKQLLITFLENGVKPSDRPVILAITEIIKHEPIFLVNELLIFIRSHSSIEENISLISYIFSMIKCDFASLEMNDLIDLSINILSNVKNENANNIDSALQILSLSPAPFKLMIEKIDDQSLQIKILRQEKTDTLTIEINLLVNRATFYLLPLPIDLLEANQNDRILQLTSKYKTMARIVNDPETSIETQILIFSKYSLFLTKGYNDMTSACMQGFSSCLPKLLELKGHINIVVLLNRIIFSPIQSWFHSNDILNVISTIPYQYYLDGTFDAIKVVDILIDFAMSTNEKLSISAMNAIAYIVNNTDFYSLTYHIAKKIDFFDDDQFHHIISIFVKILSSSTNKSRNLKHLDFFVNQIFEFRQFFMNDFSLTTQIISLLSYLDVNRIEPSVLYDFVNVSKTIINSTLSIVSGLQTDGNKNVKETEIRNEAFNYIAEQFKLMNFDSVPELEIDYSNFFPAFDTALKFLYALPINMAYKSYMINLFTYSMPLFPEMSAKFAEKYWSSYHDIRHRVNFLLIVSPNLIYIQNNNTLAIWCRLYLSVANSGLSDQLKEFSDTLHKISSSYINQFDEKTQFYPEFYAVEIYVNNDVTGIKNKIDNLSEENRYKLVEFIPKLKLHLLKKIGINEIEEKEPTQNNFHDYSEEEEEENKNENKESLNESQTVNLTSDLKANINTVKDVKESSKTSELGPILPRENKKGKSQDNQKDNKNGFKYQEPKEKAYTKETREKAYTEPKEKSYNKANKSPNKSSDVFIKKDQSYQELDPSDSFEDFQENLDNCEFLQRKLNITFDVKLITKSLLESNIIDKDPLHIFVKTQLHQKTFDFTTEQLERLIELYLNHNDISGLISVINHVKTQGKVLSIKKYLFPDNVLPIIFTYLENVSSSELLEISQYYQNTPHSYEIDLTLRSIYPNEYFNDIRNQEHITKKELAQFGETIFRANYDDHELLLEFIIDLIRGSKSKRRLEYVLTVANAIFSLTSVPKDSIDDFITACSEKYDLLPGPPLSMCVLTLAPKIESNEDFIQFIRRCYMRCLGKGSGVLRLHQALIASPGSKASENLANLSAPFLDSIIPSQYVTGVRYFTQALTSLAEPEIIPLIKANLAKLLQNFKNLRDNFPVSEVCGNPFTFMLSRDSLYVYQLEILQYTQFLIPPNEKASFTGLSPCLPRIISKYNEGSILSQLYIRSDTLLTSPGNIDMFKIYLSSLRERAEKAGNDRQKESFISDLVTQWMQNCEHYDCYAMAEIIYEWENVIFQFYELEQLLTLVCYQFFKYIPRFFPLFVGLARFVRKYDKGATDEEKEKIQSILKNSAMVNPVTAHALSTLLVNQKKYYKEALELAAFPKDCEESNQIIHSNPELVKILEAKDTLDFV